MPQLQFQYDRISAVHMAVKANRERAESNCHKLLKFWQSEGNKHISKYDADKLLGIDCATQRVANLRKAGVPVITETRSDLGENFARYYLDCTCEGGDCYLHTPTLRA